MTALVHSVMKRLFSKSRLEAWATEFSVNYFLTRSAARSYWLMVKARVFAV